jgi:hypothetical protein
MNRNETVIAGTGGLSGRKEMDDAGSQLEDGP